MNRIKKSLTALLAAALICMAGCNTAEPNSGEISGVADTSSSSVTSGSGINDTTSSAVTERGGEDSISSDGATESFGTAAAPSEGRTLAVTYSANNSWQEEGKHCTQLDFSLKNTSSDAIKGWTLSLDFKQEVEVIQSWNVTLESEGTTLSAANVDYNADIPAGAETTFGIIVKTSAATGDIAVTADGRSVGATGSFGGQTAATQQTTADEPPLPEPSEPDIGEIEVTNRAGLASEHGQLSVKGTDLVDESGKPMQLRGVSTHGIQWFPQFANKETFKHLRDEWSINVIRLAMYSGAGEGYTDSTKAGIEQTVQNAVDACIELDMYVIIDWHVLQDQSPQVRKADSLRFFEYMSAKYADYPNVIYEICNEPNGYATWGGDVKPYAEEVIPVIRKNDPDSVVIVGTPTWCQDIDKALADPLDYDNVMYALHYYAATHTDWLRDRLKNCYNSGLPIIVSEFGNCDASGNGNNDLNQAEKWLELLDSLNISYMNWSLCDKNEAASLLKPGASPTGGWSDGDLTENGRFMKEWFKNHA